MVTQQEAHDVEVAHGLTELKNNPLYVPTKLALIMSEAAEALEWHRQGKSEEIGHELADIMLRTMNLAEDLGIDLNACIEAKHKINMGRPFKHGNKLY